MSSSKRNVLLSLATILSFSALFAHADRPRAPFKVVYSNDTTNIYSCVSPYQTKASPFNSDKLRASVDETADRGIEVHMLQPGLGWVPWWTSTALPAGDHYQWFIDTYGVGVDSFGAYMMAGGDVVQVFIDRCREKGLTPFISYRLNDGHRLDNFDDVSPPNGAGNAVTQFYVNNLNYRIGTNQSNWYERVHNWAIPEVRNYKLTFIQEICANYDIDGLELDFMRMCSFFDTAATTSVQRKSIMTSVIATVRGYLDANTDPGDYKWLCVRVPCYIETHDALGIDLPAMVAAGVDMINLSSYFFTDQQAEVREVVAMTPDTPVFLEMTQTPLTGHAIPGVYDSYNYLRTTPEQFYTTANLAYAQGAAGISTFNFQYYRDHGEPLAGPFAEPPFGMFEHIGEPDWVAQQEHHYFLGAIWNHPPMTRPLPVTFSYNGASSTFTIRMAPGDHRNGKLRVRAEQSLGAGSWSARFNSHNLIPTSDVAATYHNPYPVFLGAEEDYRAWLVPQEYYQDGDNTIQITMDSGDPAKIIWIDLLAPTETSDPLVLHMDAAEAGPDAGSYWDPVVGSGSGELLGTPAHQSYADPVAQRDIFFYRFDASDPDNDQVTDLDNTGILDIGPDAYTFEAWVRLPAIIANSKSLGIIIGNADYFDTGWRFDVRCDAASGTYSLEFQQRDNEEAITPLKGVFHFRSANVLEYSSTEWVHLVFAKHAASYDGAAGAIEIGYAMWADGELLDDGARTLAAGSMDDFFFTTGNPAQISTPRDDMCYVGDIAVVRVYGRVLNQEEVTQLYNAGVQGGCADPAYYDVNGDCVIDMVDLAPVLANWLDDGRIHVSD